MNAFIFISLDRKSIAHTGVCILLFATISFARQRETVSSYHDPDEVVRKAVQNEIKVDQADTEHFLFRGTKTTPQGSTTRIYIETKDATAGLVVAYNGNALSPEQRKEEEARVERLVNNPAELQKKRQQERDNADRTMRIMRAIPDAPSCSNTEGEEPGPERHRPDLCRSDQAEVQTQSPLRTAHITRRRSFDRNAGLHTCGRDALPYRQH